MSASIKSIFDSIYWKDGRRHPITLAARELPPECDVIPRDVRVTVRELTPGIGFRGASSSNHLFLGDGVYGTVGETKSWIMPGTVIKNEPVTVFATRFDKVGGAK